MKMTLVVLMLMCSACSDGEPNPQGEPDAYQGETAHAGNFDASGLEQHPGTDANFPHQVVCIELWTVNRDAGTATCVCNVTMTPCPQG